MCTVKSSYTGRCLRLHIIEYIYIYITSQLGPSLPSCYIGAILKVNRCTYSSCKRECLGYLEVGTLEYIGDFIIIEHARIYYYSLKRTTAGNRCLCHIIIGTLILHIYIGNILIYYYSLLYFIFIFLQSADRNNLMVLNNTRGTRRDDTKALQPTSSV